MTIWKCLYGTSEGVRGMIEGSYDLPREVYDASEGVYRTIGEWYDLPGWGIWNDRRVFLIYLERYVSLQKGYMV